MENAGTVEKGGVDVPAAAAVVVGALAGGLAFLLGALFLGPGAAVVVALVAAAVSWMRHGARAALVFVGAAVFAALTLLVPAVPLLLSAVLFAAGLFANGGHTPEAAGAQSR